VLFPVASVAESNAIADVPSEFRVLGEGFDVMSMKLHTFCPALLTRRLVAGDNRPCPRSVLTAPVVPSCDWLEQRMIRPVQPFLAVLGAFH
jgi:hypothetical protein